MNALLFVLAIAPTFATALTESVNWLTPDVKLVYRDQNSAPRQTFADIGLGSETCHTRIAQAICVVDPLKDAMDNGTTRPCLPGGEVYEPSLQAAYDRFPQHLQRVFCQLEKIFVEKSTYGSAYAQLITDKNGNITGAGIGIRKDLLDLKIGIGHWASWKEQLSFGGSPTSYGVSPVLPVVNTSLNSFADFLYFVLAHEFGHILDFTNQLNHSDDCRFENNKMVGTCLPAAHSWTELSWINMLGTAQSQFDFPARKEFCFYSCKQAMDVTRASQIYTGMFRTNFISVYAAQNPMEDFADTLAYYTIDRFLGAKYVIQMTDGSVFDVIAHLNSAVLSEKVKFIDRFLLGPVKYPGE